MFDGVHLGHQSIMQRLRFVAEQKKLKTGILSFWPHPRLIFNPQDELKLLNTKEEKQALISNWNIDRLFLQSFDENFRNLSGEDFVKRILVERLHVKHIIIGYDHVFGKDKSGNFDLLLKLGSELGFEVEQMGVVNFQNTHVSSTKIRELIEQGKIKEANAMLGYAYPVSGKVVHGQKLGRIIGYPTANIATPPLKLLPRKGAYIVEVFVDGQFHKGMLSVGTNPTVEGKELTVEVHILDFSQDIYEKNILIKFRDFLHEEIKFSSLEELIKQLDRDKKTTRIFEF